MALKRLYGYAAFNIPQFRRTVTTRSEKLDIDTVQTLE